MQIDENNPRIQTKSVKENFISICDLFKLQVQKNPNAIAAIFEGSCLSYKELDYRSLQLVSFLKATGVKPESIIALSLYNSLDLIVGIMGILRSGGAYLPIDPNYPSGRIESMIEDAQPVVILTEDNLKSKFSFHPSKVALINKLSPVEQISVDEIIQPDHLAYVVFTSGSTGKPKGIMMEHRALSHAAAAYEKLHPNKLISLMSGSISFDASLLVIFHTLTSGGTVCIPKSEIVVNPEEIISLIDKHKINYTLCVPSFYSMLLNKSPKLPSLLSIDLGGENLPNEIPDLHAKIASNANLYNVYGPSEYAVGATFAKIYDPVTKQCNKITIGKPLSETQVYILNEDLQPISAGAKGEIYIGGKGLARGYLNNTDLSKEKFIWVSLPDQEPIRLYKTGDFGRLLPDGNIEFLGRMDHQVKIRGNRIELGEIEHAICQHCNVNEAVVVVQEGPNENKHLVAYFTAMLNADINQELKAHLSNLLPKYMIPSSLVQLESFPRTPNGKIDRNALPKIIEEEKERIEESLSELEQVLSDIWKKTLNMKVFSKDDSFFDLGGDSLSLVVVQTEIETKLSIKVTLTELLQYPTISQLSHHFSKQSNSKSIPVYQDLSAKKKAAFQRFKTRAGK